MIDQIKSFRKKLEADNLSLGSWVQIPNTSTTGIVANGGYDWIVVDMEHGTIDFQILPDLFRSIEKAGPLPFVRIPSTDSIYLKRVLDAGAVGIVFPDIKTRNDLESVLSHTFWPPKGTRGVGFSQANGYGDRFDSYKDISQNIVVIPMIESLEGMENLDDILSITSIDAVMIGPYDLSASLGIVGDFEHESFKSAIKEIFEKCDRHKVPVGIHVVEPSKKELNQRIEEGYKFLAYSLDTYMLVKISKNPLISL